MKMALVLVAAVALSGCGILGGINSQYKYQKTGDDCTLVVDTGRELNAGIDVQLVDCDVTVTAGNVQPGSNSVKDLTELAKTLTIGNGEGK